MALNGRKIDEFGREWAWSDQISVLVFAWADCRNQKKIPGEQSANVPA
jgi:hypothetical protein